VLVVDLGAAAAAWAAIVVPAVRVVVPIVVVLGLVVLELAVMAIGVCVVAEALALVAVIAVEIVVQSVVVLVAAAARPHAADVVVAPAIVPVIVVVVRADEMIRDAVAVDVAIRRRQRRQVRACDLRAGVEAAPESGRPWRRTAALRERERTNTERYEVKVRRMG